MRDPEDLWKHQPGDYFFLASKSRSGKWIDHPIKRDQWHKADEIIAKHRSGDLYMCPHGFTEPIRRKEYAVDPFLLYADLDEADPRDLAIRPSIAIESSPGRFVGYWHTDNPASEDLNRRLAYSVSADTSGWDRTQVLRIPGTRNRKYSPAPQVKVLWANGPTYRLEKLNRMLPEVAGTTLHSSEESAALKVYRKYENHIPRWARKELLEGNPRTGKRSEVLWKLQGALIEAGCSSEECFILLWASPWNKFADRRGGEDQLRNELDKNLARRINHESPEDKKKADNVWNPLPISMDMVERRNIDWLVPGMLARKELTIVEGDPGLGKSYLVQVISGLICDGKPIPVLDHYKPPCGNVAYFDTENTGDTVTKARLEENGVVNLNRYFQGEEAFTIDDEERWQLVVDRLSELKPELVVFDTINTYIGSTDTYRSSETQQAMGFFKYIATSLNCAVILLRHLTKGGGQRAIYRGQGSIAFTGAARIVATVGSVPDDDTENIRVVACTKNNLTKPFRSFTYSIESLPDKPDRKNRSKLIWGEMVDLSSDAILTNPSQMNGHSNGSDKGPKVKSEIDLAKEVMETILKDHSSISINKILKQAEGRSIGRNAVHKAAEILELRRVQVTKGEFHWVRQ